MAKRILNYRSFNIFTIEKQVWDYGYHSHNFYELILIDEGMGMHHINGVTFGYKKGDIFLLTPADFHEFIIDQSTHFTYIKFNDSFLENLPIYMSKSNWKGMFLIALSGKWVKDGSWIANRDESLAVFQLAKLLLYEFANKQLQNIDVIACLLNALLTIIVRNMNHGSGREKRSLTEEKRIENILSYINVNVLDKEKMKLKAMADEFLMSENYISIFVKRHTGASIQSHIAQHKIKAAERLLTQSNYNINEIADRLGFSDSSHFIKLFRKYFTVSPVTYRNNHAKK